MTTATIKLYDILVDKGVDKTLAREALDEFLTLDEAVQTLATKQDISDVKDQLRSVIMWVAGLLIGQIAIMTAIMAIMFSFYAG